jgi:hypothetical protein
VDIVFVNGSKIRATIQSEKIEIVSIYGKLAVPMADIQSIEFGLRYPDGMMEKIEGAIKGLASGNYATREAAANTLFDAGPRAYPILMRTLKAKEPEVAARAKELIQKLHAKYSEKELQLGPDDRIVTPTQTLVGRIATSSVKTKAEYFGEMEHKLVHMRTWRTIQPAGAEFSFSVDATKYANVGQWMNTGYTVDSVNKIEITAKGQVDQWPQGPGQYMCGPGGLGAGQGFGGMTPGSKLPPNLNNFGRGAGVYAGVLVGKIGDDGEPFVIGDRYEFRPPTDGTLFLHILPSPWNCATTGTYDVKISPK